MRGLPGGAKLNQPVARQPTRDRILDTAFRLFYAHGPRGVGVDTTD